MERVRVIRKHSIWPAVPSSAPSAAGPATPRRSAPSRSPTARWTCAPGSPPPRRGCSSARETAPASTNAPRSALGCGPGRGGASRGPRWRWVLVGAGRSYRAAPHPRINLKHGREVLHHAVVTALTRQVEGRHLVAVAHEEFRAPGAPRTLAVSCPHLTSTCTQTEDQSMARFFVL